MQRIHNATPQPVALTDTVTGFGLYMPPGTHLDIPTGTWTAAWSNQPSVSLPTNGSFTAILGSVEDAGDVTLTVAQLEPVNLGGIAFAGIGLVLGIGLPILAVRWFHKLTSTRIDD